MTGSAVFWLQPEALALYSSILLFGAWVFVKNNQLVRLLYLVLTILVFASAIFIPPQPAFGFGNLSLDLYTVIARTLLLVLFLIVSFYLAGIKSEKFDGAFYGLSFLSLLGSILMIEVGDLISLLLALEISSIASYALASYLRSRRELEAVVKYYLFGGLASALFVFGIGILGSLSGGTSYEQVCAYFAGPDTPHALAYAGLLLVLAAFSYKVAVFPWQLYAPDFYEGQNLPALMYNAIIPKSAGLFAIVSFARLMPKTDNLIYLISFIVVFSWIYANFSALVEKSFLRLAAFSSISHAAFVLLSLILPYNELEKVSLVYVFSYGISTSALLGTVIFGARGKIDISHLKNILKTNPLSAFGFAVAVFSLAGVPPLPVFFGKYFLFKELVLSGHLYLAVAGGLFSAIALGYYLRLLQEAFLKAEETKTEEVQPEGMVFPISFNVLMLMLFVIYVSDLFLILPPANL